MMRDQDLFALERLVDAYGTEKVHEAVAALGRGAHSSSARNIHLNWSACKEWDQVRGRLRFLRTTLFGNFADVRGEVEKVSGQLRAAGFEVSCGWHFGGAVCLRMSDQEDIN